MTGYKSLHIRRAKESRKEIKETKWSTDIRKDTLKITSKIVSPSYSTLPVRLCGMTKNNLNFNLGKKVRYLTLLRIPVVSPLINSAQSSKSNCCNFRRQVHHSIRDPTDSSTNAMPMAHRILKSQALVLALSNSSSVCLTQHQTNQFNTGFRVALSVLGASILQGQGRLIGSRY